MDKRCFVCGHKENEDGSCTNSSCPRYVEQTETTTTATNASN
ncbi:hypothetical protein SAMN05660900_00881 [Megasphaera cerevisiae DSM 20462]|nr:hypothetical protein SAMN05660900_00881 [Megasphaera cerevisiae DSM 20462]